MTETEHQILLMCWAKKTALAGRKELDLLFHIPNGGSRSKREGVTFKAMGVKPGVSYLFLPVPSFGISSPADGISFVDGYSGLWIEMKAEEGKISDDQWKWIFAMRKNGYAAYTCFGWEHAVRQIKSYLGGVFPEVDMSEMEGRLCGERSESERTTG